jgi:hypothetical protein
VVAEPRPIASQNHRSRRIFGKIEALFGGGVFLYRLGKYLDEKLPAETGWLRNPENVAAQQQSF